MDQVAGSSKHQFRVSLDYRFIITLLVIVIVAMLAVWQPWAIPGTNARVVSATGSTTLKAVPDEYVFSPSYEFKDTNKDVALASLTKRSSEIVTQLKALGVPDSKIQTTSTGSSSGIYYLYSPGGQPTYNLTLTITLDDKALVQKVQDYLVTTTPSGSVSPQPTFSMAKQKALQAQARDAAAIDAKSNALQMAKTLGYHLGAVKSVTDSADSGPIPVDATTIENGASSAKSTGSSLAVQPGENEISYTVTVVYYIH